MQTTWRLETQTVLPGPYPPACRFEADIRRANPRSRRMIPASDAPWQMTMAPPLAEETLMIEATALVCQADQTFSLEPTPLPGPSNQQMRVGEGESMWRPYC